MGDPSRAADPGNLLFSQSRAGFILAGSQSTRMGQEKTLLRFEGSSLVERVAGRMRAAVYHRRCMPAVERETTRKTFKMHDVIDTLRTLRWALADPSLVRNIHPLVEWRGL